jgi:hypothetical protein
LHLSEIQLTTGIHHTFSAPCMHTKPNQQPTGYHPCLTLRSPEFECPGAQIKSLFASIHADVASSPHKQMVF